MNEWLNRKLDESKSYYFVIRDYIARRSDELTLRVGQYVKVVDNRDNSWWYGICEGMVGYFPSEMSANYLTATIGTI
ncbi:hypothetical protein AHF37_04414 [Paragonimus kellicotti]|nr:hypothetical protein AHF37_04414 [Paragonimus kellicotti]